MTHQYIAGLVSRLFMSSVAIFSMGIFWSRARPYMGRLLAVTLGLITTFGLTLDTLIIYSAYRPYTPRVFVAASLSCGLFVVLVAYAVHRRFKERP
jgi:hypothetical protein